MPARTLTTVGVLVLVGPGKHSDLAMNLGQGIPLTRRRSPCGTWARWEREETDRGGEA